MAASVDGGWLKANPLPADKGSYGTFDEVALQNRVRCIRKMLVHNFKHHAQKILQEILARNATSLPSPDAQMLIKLQDLYQSCILEDHLNSLGIQPLIEIVSTLKDIFNQSSTNVELSRPRQHILGVEARHGLTAALAYLHSLGERSSYCLDYVSNHT